MFSLTTSVANSQIALPVYNLSQLLVYRPVPKRNNLNTRSKDNQATSTRLDAIENRTITELCARLELNRSDKDVPKMLRQFALYGSSNQSVINLIQTRNYSQLAKRNPWHESHTSFQTFSENKTDVMSNASSLFGDSVRKWGETSPLLIGTRTFKTKRATRTFEPEPLDPKILQDFKGVSSTLSGELKETFTSSLKKEPMEESQKKMKLAFAEGYTLGVQNISPSVKMRTVLRNILLIGVPLAILLYVARKLKIVSLQMNLFSKEVNPAEINVTFEDVQGAEEAKQELLEVVEFLKNPNKYTNLGAELPKGVLLVGPPGTGKTLLARAVAGEAKVPFFHAAGAEFDEMLVGQGARRVRELFSAAKAKAPCVIFLDEVDSVGAKRTNSLLHPYANQTINQLLAEMDGFVKNEGVIVLGATNRRDNLDKALLRPGRFDVEIQVSLPNQEERWQLFKYYLSKIKFGSDVNPQILARGTTGFTGADIKNVVNQAALRAATEEDDNVCMTHLEHARDKVLMGPEKNKRIPDEKVNLITAYHEGGHTLVSFFTRDSMKLHKVTIIPRGQSLGHTAYIPDKEQYHQTRSEMLARLDSLMGGRAAEELIFGNDYVTSGSSMDLQIATSIAEKMVKGYGMSDKVGLRSFRESTPDIMSVTDDLSVSTKESIDSEIKKLLQESYERAKAILVKHQKEHKALAEALLKHETLNATDISNIINGQPLTNERI